MPRARQLTCGICGEEKYDNGSKLVCRSCNRRRVANWQKSKPDLANARNRRFREANPERANEISRRSKIRKNYGMELEDYEAMLLEQGGVCAICKLPETRRHQDGTPWNMPVDHDHETGAVRGLLCANCNTGIANFRDNPAFLAHAIQYLNAHAAKAVAA